MSKIIDPERELRKIRRENDALKAAQNAINFCAYSWKSKRPLHCNLSNKEKWDVKSTRSIMRNLYKSSKRFPLEHTPLYRHDIEKYHNSLSQAAGNYLQGVSSYNKNDRGRSRDSYSHFAELGLVLFGINDISVSVKNASRVRAGTASLETLHDESEKKVMEVYDKIYKFGNIEFKGSNDIADVVWSYFEVDSPISAVGDKSVIERVLLGHPKSWKKAYNNLHGNVGSNSVLKYMDDLKNKYSGKPDWYKNISIVSMLHIFFAQSVTELKLKSICSEKPPSYIS